ncbi:MAG: cobalt ECF transporter T component CbiQ [Desulfovibrio sp.]|nr:cobalt ECF transporter T component CbiQ [Desulfovibrio sp.]
MVEQSLFHASCIHHLDPRLRISCAMCLAICFSMLRSLAGCLTGLFIGVVLLVLSRPQWRPIRRRLMTINIFVLFLWCITPLTTPGTALIQYGAIDVSLEGTQLALLVTLKANAIACIFLTLICTMSITEAGHALECLRCPNKLVFLFLFTARYLHVIAKEWSILFTSAKLRGFIPHTNILTYRTLASLLGLLLVRSYMRAQRVHDAMLLRGFTGHFRTITTFRTRPFDFYFLLAMLLCVTAVFFTEYFGDTYV